MTTQQTIQQKLTAAFHPLNLEVINESDNHSVPPGSGSHVKVVLVSEAFEGETLIKRHRQVNQVLAEELAGGVHALALHTMTPEEWFSRGGTSPESPECLGVPNRADGAMRRLLAILTGRSRPRRTPEQQQQVDEALTQLALYHFPTCPYSLRVRRVMRRLRLNIELRDAARNPAYQQELRREGGRLQTPCLKIRQQHKTTTWLYESADIIRYLEQRFAYRQAD